MWGAFGTAAGVSDTGEAKKAEAGVDPCVGLCPLPTRTRPCWGERDRPGKLKTEGITHVPRERAGLQSYPAPSTVQEHARVCKGIPDTRLLHDGHSLDWASPMPAPLRGMRRRGTGTWLGHEWDQ